MPGGLEKGKYFLTLLSGKKPREGLLGQVLLLEMVVSFECMMVYLSLGFFASLTMSTRGDLYPVLSVGYGPGMVCDGS